jgi:hypothetical protein
MTGHSELSDDVIPTSGLPTIRELSHGGRFKRRIPDGWSANRKLEISLVTSGWPVTRRNRVAGVSPIVKELLERIKVLRCFFLNTQRKSLITTTSLLISPRASASHFPFRDQANPKICPDVK